MPKKNSDKNSSLTLSDRGYALIMRFEGFSSVEYKDRAGLSTIGFGHQLQNGEHYFNGMTRQQAEALLKHDTENAETVIHQLVGVVLSQNQYDALASFIYNIGGRAFAASTLLRLLNGGNYKKAADELLNWNKIKADGVYIESPGLSARRAAERALFIEQAVAD